MPYTLQMAGRPRPRCPAIKVATALGPQRAWDNRNNIYLGAGGPSFFLWMLNQGGFPNDFPVVGGGGALVQVFNIGAPLPRGGAEGRSGSLTGVSTPRPNSLFCVFFFEMLEISFGTPILSHS